MYPRVLDLVESGPSVPFSGSAVARPERLHAGYVGASGADLFPFSISTAAYGGCWSKPLENSIASTSIFVLQATKSQRWMPWRLKPMKDVGGCEKPRGAADQASIRGYPNGETHCPSRAVLRSEHIGPVEGTRGIETSQYPEEEKATATP
jgi:hypothetical protein